MKKKSTPLLQLSAFIILFCLVNVTALAQVEISGWNFNGLSTYGASPMNPTTNNANLTIGGLTRGAGTSAGGAILIQSNAWGGKGFDSPGTKASAIGYSDFFSFTLTPKTNSNLSVKSIGAYNLYVSQYTWFIITWSEDGPINAIWQYQVGSGTYTDIGSMITLTRGIGNALAAIDLSGISELQNISPNTTVTFRLVAWNAGNNNGGLSIYDPEGDATNDLIINGITAPTVGNITPPAGICEGGNINISLPTITENGATISVQGWEIETNPGSGTYNNITLPYTPVLADNGKKIRYYAVNSHGRTTSNEVTVSVNQLPSITSVTHNFRCNNGVVNLSATTNTGTINWYANAVGGASIATGGTFSPSITTTTTYYVSSTSGGCTTATRTPVVATKGKPAIPTTIPNSRCGIGTVTLNASVVNGTINWYQNPSGGVSLGTGTSFTTPIISSSTTYHVSATNTCGTSSRSSISATIDPIPSIIDVTSGKICNNGTVTLGANASGSSTINWYESTSSTISIQTGTSFITPTLSAETTYYVDATLGSCTSNPRVPVYVTLRSSNTEWTGAIDSNWDDDGNWTNGAPCGITNITIPDVSQTGVSYPTINTSATCKNIVFEPGGALKGIEKLHYEKAFIQLNVTRDRWYALTPPLKEMYSGDYYFNGAPESFMRLFDTVNPDNLGPNINYEGKFTTSFSSLQVPLSAGYGFAFNVSQRTGDYPNGFYNNSSDMIVTLPRINPDSTLIETYYPYSSYTGRVFTFSPKTVEKDDKYAYRFAFENADSIMTNKTISIQSGLNLIGNPIMTHLDINAFLNSNSSSISNYIKLWSNGIYYTYDGDTDSWDGGYTGDFVAPMQSFLVNNYNAGDSNILFDLDNHFDKDQAKTSVLRSALSTKQNVLFINASKDGKTTGTVMTKQDHATNNYDNSDIFKLFTPSVEIADVYSISDEHALAFNKFNSYPFSAPIGIKTNQTGKVKLDFSGAESFYDANVYLVNTSTGEEIDLKGNNSYEFDITNENAAGSLFILFRSAFTTKSIETSASEEIQIFATENNSIKVIAAPNDKIKEIAVYDLSGKIIQHCNTPVVESCELPLFNKRSVVVIQVYTEKNSKISKVYFK